MFGKRTSRDDLRARLPGEMPALWRFALSLTGRPDMADDLVQATCLRALERADQFHDDGRLRGWVLTICRSIWLNELRAVTRRKTGALDAVPEAALVDNAPSAEMNVFASEVFTQVMALPEAQRATVVLVFVEQVSYAEAAEILGVPVGTIMSRLHGARQKLRRLNEDNMPSARSKG